MPNGSFSSHYVPRLVLRKFSNRLCTYNIKTGELRENIAPSMPLRKTLFMTSTLKEH